MKKTYTRTLMVADLEKATFKLYINEGCKYTAKTAEDLGKEFEVEYTGVTSYDIIEGGVEAEAIEAETDEDGVDEFHEYLVLHFSNGETSTFRNSHVTLFIR